MVARVIKSYRKNGSISRKNIKSAIKKLSLPKNKHQLDSKNIKSMNNKKKVLM